MPLIAVCSRHIPSAPALPQRTLVVRDERGRFERISIGIGQNRKHQESRDRGTGLKGVMANRALFGLRLDDRVRIVLLAERVKGRPILRIKCCNFNELTVIDPPHVNIVVEINRARSFG